MLVEGFLHSSITPDIFFKNRLCMFFSSMSLSFNPGLALGLAWAVLLSAILVNNKTSANSIKNVNANVKFNDYKWKLLFPKIIQTRNWKLCIYNKLSLAHKFNFSIASPSQKWIERQKQQHKSSCVFKRRKKFKLHVLLPYCQCKVGILWELKSLNKKHPVNVYMWRCKLE